MGEVWGDTTNVTLFGVTVDGVSADGVVHSATPTVWQNPPSPGLQTGQPPVSWATAAGIVVWPLTTSAMTPAVALSCSR